MTENRESTLTARVYEVEPVQRPGPRRMAPGWYYEIEGEDPEGPFDTQIKAGAAAREVILGHARAVAVAGDGDTVDIGPGPGDSSLRATITNRRDIERRALASDHFAGSDRRMRDRRGPLPEPELGRQGQVRITTIGGIAWRDLAVPGDHHLDRTEGCNKYAVINMRAFDAITDEASKLELCHAIGILRKHGLFNPGLSKTEGEFFVLMLKDEFSDVALLRYADAARAAGMPDYADDILQLTMRAGHGSPWCKRPD